VHSGAAVKCNKLSLARLTQLKAPQANLYHFNKLQSTRCSHVYFILFGVYRVRRYHLSILCLQFLRNRRAGKLIRIRKRVQEFPYPLDLSGACRNTLLIMLRGDAVAFADLVRRGTRLGPYLFHLTTLSHRQ
jgi:hypothetical protein